VIGSLVGYFYAPDDPERVVETMAAPATRIVSLTVTEGGYNFHAVTGEFDATHPDLVANLVPGARPRTVFGLVTEALRRRRDRGLPAFTVRSCDNIQGNGDTARRSFTAFARLQDEEFGGWPQPSATSGTCAATGWCARRPRTRCSCGTCSATWTGR
jgi:mannitol 2-dehydrogenase